MVGRRAHRSTCFKTRRQVNDSRLETKNACSKDQRGVRNIELCRNREVGQQVSFKRKNCYKGIMSKLFTRLSGRNRTRMDQAVPECHPGYASCLCKMNSRRGRSDRDHPERYTWKDQQVDNSKVGHLHITVVQASLVSCENLSLRDFLREFPVPTRKLHI